MSARIGLFDWLNEGNEQCLAVEIELAIREVVTLFFNVAVDIEPAAILADKAAVFMQLDRHARRSCNER